MPTDWARPSGRRLEQNEYEGVHDVRRVRPDDDKESYDGDSTDSDEAMYKNSSNYNPGPPTQEEQQQLGTVQMFGHRGRLYEYSWPFFRRAWERLFGALSDQALLDESDREDFMHNAHDPNWMPKKAGRSPALVEAWLHRLSSHTVTADESIFEVFDQENVQPGEILCVLPCGHKFRIENLGNLFILMPRSHCPECRQDYTQDIDPDAPPPATPTALEPPQTMTPPPAPEAPTVLESPQPVSSSHATTSQSSPTNNTPRTVVGVQQNESWTPSQQTHTGDLRLTEPWAPQNLQDPFPHTHTGDHRPATGLEIAQNEQITRILNLPSDAYYDILSLANRTSMAEVVNGSYISLSFLVHPRHCPHPSALEALLRLNEAQSWVSGHLGEAQPFVAPPQMPQTPLRSPTQALRQHQSPPSTQAPIQPPTQSAPTAAPAQEPNHHSWNSFIRGETGNVPPSLPSRAPSQTPSKTTSTTDNHAPTQAPSHAPSLAPSTTTSSAPRHPPPRRTHGPRPSSTVYTSGGRPTVRPTVGWQFQEIDGEMKVWYSGRWRALIQNRPSFTGVRVGEGGYIMPTLSEFLNANQQKKVDGQAKFEFNSHP